MRFDVGRWQNMLRPAFFVLACSFVVNSYRLPQTVLPEHYRLEIISYLGEKDNFNFDGKVWITINCLHDSPNITLHSKHLDVNKYEITVRDTSTNATDKVKNIDFEDENEFLFILLEKPIKQDHQYELFLSFKGKLDDNLAGFYRSTYHDKMTKLKKWLGVTQFEATSARYAFPCFDEPEMKATFDISIGRKEGYQAISNMPLVRTEPLKGRKGFFWDRFGTSVPMSTYLVAWVVSEFEYKTGYEVEQNNVTFRIWARKDALDQVDFAADVGPKILAYYEQFFNIKYPLPKQDMVAIPDFSSGAMENWGLITYREAVLLYDPKVSTRSSKARVAEVIAHELAHQWFGNLVTMKWWTDLWLNEGFATYMSSLAVEALFPEWNYLEGENADYMTEVFGFDSLRTSHPVSVPIGNPKEIDEIFDVISYRKGSCILRMMNLFLGQGVIRSGVSNYLKKHKYSNAEQDDLWESLTEEAHKSDALSKNMSVKQVMDSWTVQTGYPVVTVTRDYTRKTAELVQKRFLSDIIDSKDDSNPCWWVPLSYSTESDNNFNHTVPKQWMSCPRQTTIIENLADENEWVIFNNQMSGIYRVNYDLKNWELLTKYLYGKNFKKIPTLNRVQLLTDSASLAYVGTLKYDTFFKLLKYLKHETELVPWKAALEKIGAITINLKKTSAFGGFKEYMKKLLTPFYEKIGGLDALTQQQQSLKMDKIKLYQLVVDKSCYFEVSNCINHAKNLFKKFAENPSQNVVPKDLRSIVYCTSLRDGGEDEWNFLWGLFQQTNTASEKSLLLESLGCTEEVWLLSRFLDYSLNTTLIRKQDSYAVFGTVVSRTPVGYYVAKSFFYENIEKIFKIISNKRGITRYLSSLSRQMSDPREQQELESFINQHKKSFSYEKRGVQQSLESIKLNIQWQNAHAEEIKHILRKYEPQEEPKETS